MRTKDIIKIAFYRFKGIQLINMKPVLSLFLVLLTTVCSGQQRILSKELTMGFLVLKNHQPVEYNLPGLENFLDKPVSTTPFTKENWFDRTPRISQFKFGGAIGIKRSKNFRNELLLGLHVSGQFQHRTFFSGTTETMREETVINPKLGHTRQVLAFKTIFLSEIRDFVFVNPSLHGRIHINQRIGINLSTTLGVGLPFKNGLQMSSYEGEIIRDIQNNDVLEESRTSYGEVEFEWHKLPFSLGLQSQVSGNIEFKPFELKPLYLTVGCILGRQYQLNNGSHFNYSGGEIAIISRF